MMNAVMGTAEQVIGIDLGTTTTCTAAVIDGRPRVIPDVNGRRFIPTMVAYTPKGTVVGDEARERLVIDPENTIYSFKRLMGRRFDDPQARVAISAAPYRIEAGHGGAAVVEARGQQYSIPEVASKILKHVITSAEQQLDVKVRRAVIGVPASFDEQQCSAVKVAGRIAGLEAVQLIEEPRAAALSFGVLNHHEGVVCVYDFGGGTFDMTLLWNTDGGLETIATASDGMLGGDDLDVALAFSAAEAFRVQTGRNLWRDVAEWQRLLFACEEAKRRLSNEPTTEIRLRSVARTPSGVRDLVYRLDRRRFRQICGDKIEQTLKICAAGLTEASRAPSEVNKLILVGGSTFIRVVRARAADFFELRPDVSIDPIEAVAIGAAIHGANWAGAPLEGPQPPRLLEVAPAAIGIATSQEPTIVFERFEPLPARELRTVPIRSKDRSVRIEVFQRQGERSWRSIGELSMEGLEPGGERRLPLDLWITYMEDVIDLRLLDPWTGREVSAKLTLSEP